MGNLSHGIVSQAVHERVQAEGCAAAGARGIDSGGGAGMEVNANVLHRWRREFREGPGDAFSGNGKPALVGGADSGAGLQARPAGAGNRFFEGMLVAHRGTADAAGIDWKSAVYRKVQEEMKANRGLTIERMVELGLVSRSGFYRFGGGEQRQRADRDMDLRDAIQRIALQWPCYGRPRITRELRPRG